MRSNKDLKIALDHLWYEILMFKISYRVLMQNCLQLDFNFGIEIFLIHLRNLIYFIQDKNWETDIRCSDFGIDKQEINLPKDNNLHIIDKFLSHLTWERVDQKKPQWDKEIREKINSEICKLFIIFINKLSDDVFPTVKGRNRVDFIDLVR